MKTPLLLLFALFAISIHAQDYQKSLYGFYLSQYKEITAGEFGKAYRSDTFEDGYVQDIYLVHDTSLYMVFEYEPPHPESIWSIQIAGSDGRDIGFHSLRLGSGQAQVTTALGRPDTVIDIAEYGYRWEYRHSNYSVEINKKGKLSSIKIKERPELFDTGKYAEKIPDFETVRKQLRSAKNEEIMKILAPDLEIYRGDTMLFFAKPINKEVATDASGVFALIRKASKGLASINPKDAAQYETNIRISELMTPQHVIKIVKGYGIRELALRMAAGEWVIWEIRLE